MDNETVSSSVIEIFRTHFHHSGACGPSTSKADVADWSSLNHVLFFVKLEQHFKIKFSGPELIQGTSLGTVIHLVQFKLGTS
jgi:acyl carrier protein